MGVYRSALWVLLLGAVVACSGDDDTVSTTAPPAANELSDESAVAAAQAFGVAMSTGDVASAAGLFSESWVRVGILMTEGDAGLSPPNELDDGLDFLAAWTRFGARDCTADSQGSVVRVQCLADVSGPYPDALGLEPFELPVRFTVVADGISSFATDYDAIGEGTVGATAWVPTAETEAYVVALPRFYRYASGDSEFVAQHFESIGQPVVSAESADAHLALAEQWTAAGRP